jgi:hypothetical protein
MRRDWAFRQREGQARCGCGGLAGCAGELPIRLDGPTMVGFVL